MIALYPGSFDPVTYGHIDTALRAARIFGTVVVAVFDRPNKNLLFSTEERLEMIRDSLRDYPAIQVTTYASLTVHFAREIGAGVIVRGLRDSVDFDLEYQIAQVNQIVDPGIDMVVFMANRKFSFLSSSIVREIAGLGGDVSELVPAHVAQALQRKFAS